MLKVKCCTFFQYKFLECLSEGYNFTTSPLSCTLGYGQQGFNYSKLEMSFRSPQKSV